MNEYNCNPHIHVKHENRVGIQMKFTHLGKSKLHANRSITINDLPYLMSLQNGLIHARFTLESQRHLRQ